MQSSFKVIKNSNMSDGRKDINTSFTKQESPVVQNETVIYKPMESYENIGNTIISEAKKKSELILSNTYQELEKMRKEVYESAYNEGYEAGSREGLKRAYEEGYRMNIAKVQALKEDAEKMLLDSNEEVNKYLKQKETDIKFLIQNAVENILRREVKDRDSMDRSITEVLEAFKDSKTFIIKCCSLYNDELKSKVEIWKEKLPFNGEIFVICDDSLSEGSVIVQRENGSTEISIEESLDKLRNILFSEE